MEVAAVGVDDPELWRRAADHAEGDALVAQAPTVEPLFSQGTPPWYPAFSSAVNTNINSAAKGEITVDQAMQNIADGAKKAMAQ